MKILAKLITGFLAVAVMCGIVGIVGIMQIDNLNTNIEELSNQTIPTLGYLKTIDLEMTNLKVALRTITNPMVFDDDETYRRQQDNIEKARITYRTALESYEATKKTPDEQKLYDTVKSLLDIAVAYNNSVFKLVETARKIPVNNRGPYLADIYDSIASDKRLAFDNLQAALKKLIAYDQQYYGVELPKAALQSAEMAGKILFGVTALAFIIALILGILLGTSISKSLRKSVSILNKIADGDISERMTTKSKDEFGQVANSLNTLISTIENLINEMQALTKAAVDGRLEVRGNANKFKGGYRDVIDGVNSTLDAVITPLNMAADYIDKIAKGALPEKITANYSGDFNKIKDNLNLAIDSINALIDDTAMLNESAIGGALQTRADATRHEGDYRKIIEGINTMLDLVITPINETIAVFKRLAEGDLTMRMAGDYRGDFDILKTSLNESLESINSTLGQINTAVEQVAEGSVQVSQASQALSQGATEQAASLEEITSSTTEISSQTKQNTENALKMNSLAREAQENAEKGNSQMKELVSAMSDINTSAEEIRKIVKTIDDISFQINLLALNANVEAARAGKYGKGFAVVAEEVRNLAVRSANSVKDTTRMVDEAIGNIQKGNALVDGTASQLDEIVGGSAQVATLADEVATAGREQTQGLEQISLGLNQIDQVTQSNTASAEESASASEELSSQAQQVKSMLARFKLKVTEKSLNNTEVIAMLRAELENRDRQGKAQATSHIQVAAKPTMSQKAHARNPADVISLDDNNFGKF
jgi:methyl-accepting chemotaxis protein